MSTILESTGAQMTSLFTDFDKAVFSCQVAKDERREISDLTARIIASMYHQGGLSASYAFLSTGYIGESSSDLWREFFPDYEALIFNEKLLADMLGTYLLNRADREALDCWSGLHW